MLPVAAHTILDRQREAEVSTKRELWLGALFVSPSSSLPFSLSFSLILFSFSLFISSPFDLALYLFLSLSLCRFLFSRINITRRRGIEGPHPPPPHAAKTVFEGRLHQSPQEVARGERSEKSKANDKANPMKAQNWFALDGGEAVSASML